MTKKQSMAPPVPAAKPPGKKPLKTIEAVKASDAAKTGSAAKTGTAVKIIDMLGEEMVATFEV